MDSADRKKLAKFASERLYATADDEEQWSFLFRTRGAVSYLYCPWSVTEDWEFAPCLLGERLRCQEATLRISKARMS
jgi:hypothetical protein